MYKIFTWKIIRIIANRIMLIVTRLIVIILLIMCRIKLLPFALWWFDCFCFLSVSTFFFVNWWRHFFRWFLFPWFPPGAILVWCDSKCSGPRRKLVHSVCKLLTFTTHLNRLLSALSVPARAAHSHLWNLVVNKVHLFIDPNFFFPHPPLVAATRAALALFQSWHLLSQQVWWGKMELLLTSEKSQAKKRVRRWTAALEYANKVEWSSFCEVDKRRRRKI